MIAFIGTLCLSLAALWIVSGCVWIVENEGWKTFGATILMVLWGLGFVAFWGGMTAWLLMAR